MAFAEVGDVLDRVGDLSDADLSRLPALLEDATDAIRAAAGGQNISPPVVADVATLVGAGRKRLRLPQVPVTDVTNVTITTGTSRVLMAEEYGWDADGRLERLRGLRWAGTVTVTYNHGYAADALVLDPLRGLCARLVAEMMGTGLANSGEAAIQSEAVGDYRVTFADPRAGIFGTRSVWQASDRRVLDRFTPVLSP